MESNIPADCEHHISQLFKTPELRSEIRAYLRHRLFTSIQNTALGPRLSRRDVQPISPKLQTLNLLIAEYLLRNRHHFSLSVFACEVPSVSCLSLSIQDTLMGRTCPSTIPFKPDDLRDMLDTLGIQPDSAKGQELTNTYRQKEQPLLECLIRALPQLASVPVSLVTQQRDQSCSTEAINVESPMKDHQQQINKLKSMYDEKLQEEEAEWSSRVAAQERLLQQERSRHTEEEQKLRELVNTLQDQVALAQNTLAALRTEKSLEQQRFEEERRKLESETEATQHKLHLRQLSLSEEVQRLEKEKLVLKKVKKKLQNQQKQLDDATVALAQYQAEAAPEKSMASALEIQLQVKDLEMSELRASVSSLKDENTSLRNLTEQQRQRIETLNVRLAELVSELHCTKERFVDTSIHRFTSSRHRSSSSDSSPTDDIVKDAKRRIKHLEEEFEAIGRYHKNFQAKHLNDSIMSSVHGSSSGQLFLPVPRTPTSTVHHNISLPNLDHNASLSPQFGIPCQTYQTHPPSIPKFTKLYSPRQRIVEVPKHVTINDSQPSKAQDKTIPTTVNNVSNNSNSTVSESAKDLNNSSVESSKKVDPLVDQTSDLVKALTLSRGMELSSNAQLVSSHPINGLDDPNTSHDKIDASNTQPTASNGTYLVQSVQNTPSFGEMNLTSNLQLIPSNDTHVVESIGPMGDAQPAQSTSFLDISNVKITKTNGDTTGDAQTIVPSIQVNPPSNVNGNSVVKEQLTKQRVTLIPNVSRETNEESQKSTSSSSKHISVGAASSKDDADDFWNL